jgi:hypothetical protein
MVSRPQKGNKTVTYEELQNNFRQLISPSFAMVANELKSGGMLPLDKRNNELEIVLVECYFPEMMMMRGTLRDSLADKTTPSQSVYAYIGSYKPFFDVIPSELIPSDCGEPILDTETNWMKVIPSKTYTCTVQCIKGDYRTNRVMQQYIIMQDEPPLTKYGNQIIWGSEPPTIGHYIYGDICINNGTDLVNESDFVITCTTDTCTITPPTYYLNSGWFCSEEGYPGTWVPISFINPNTGD